MDSLTNDQLLEESLNLAISKAKTEAVETPFQPGTIVGHTNFAKFGGKEAMFVKYSGDQNQYATVLNGNAQVVTWESEGMVDVARVAELTDAIYNEGLRLVASTKLLNLLTDLLLGVADANATEPCDCEFCTDERLAKADAQADALANGNTAPARKLQEGCFCGQHFVGEEAEVGF